MFGGVVVGTINILKNGYRGKLGATVGQQWNGQLTLRTYLEHNNSKTEAQLKQRAAFKEGIRIAQTTYPYIQNVLLPKGYKGTKWNFIASAIGVIMGGNGIDPDGIIIGDYNKKNLMLPAFPFYDGKQYAYIYFSSTNHSLDVADYSPAIIPFFDPIRPVPANYKLVEFGSILNKSITINFMGSKPQKGFLLEVKNIDFTIAPVIFALQGRAVLHNYKSAFYPVVPSVNLTDNMLEDN